MKNITQSNEWQNLLAHWQKISKFHMRDLFNEDANRFNNFSMRAVGLFFDYSKNRMTSETLKLLLALSHVANLSAYIEQMFSGQIINTTEKRAVLHTALRNPNGKSEIRSVLDKMFKCAEKIRNKKWTGFSGEPITNVVNIGIGGSDLGPAMVTSALQPYTSSNVTCCFVSNVDGSHISETLKLLNPETTLFIIASKTFTTQETLCNANTAKEWLEQKIKTTGNLKQHLIAVTAKPEKAQEFGIDTDNIFPFWDWVGGRYSLWSAIGLSIAIAIGADNFEQLLAGAHDMDEHFRNTPFAENMPVIMALLGIWNINFFDARTLAVLPYDQYLHLLPAYLQQLEMESNGKHVNLDGKSVNYLTAPVIWGAPGTNGQHAFHQLLLQGTQIIPADFIIPVHSHNPIGDHHLLLFANCLAQSRALMKGKTKEEVIQELVEQGMNQEQAEQLSPHKIISGNNPSNTIVLDKVTPHSLGALIALYEHKVFVQGVIWGINSFDQWGVELGKQITKNITPKLQKDGDKTDFDASTNGLIKYFHQN